MIEAICRHVSALVLETIEHLPVKVLHQLGVLVQGVLVAVHNKPAECHRHGLDSSVVHGSSDDQKHLTAAGPVCTKTRDVDEVQNIDRYMQPQEEPETLALHEFDRCRAEQPDIPPALAAMKALTEVMRASKGT
jgi:hypothetical protein